MCGKFRIDLNSSVTGKNLGYLGWFSRCFCEIKKETGRPPMFQTTCMEETWRQNTDKLGVRAFLCLRRAGVNLSDFDGEEVLEAALTPFLELVGLLMWLAIQTSRIGILTNYSSPSNPV